MSQGAGNGSAPASFTHRYGALISHAYPPIPVCEGLDELDLLEQSPKGHPLRRPTSGGGWDVMRRLVLFSSRFFPWLLPQSRRSSSSFTHCPKLLLVLPSSQMPSRTTLSRLLFYLFIVVALYLLMFEMWEVKHLARDTVVLEHLFNRQFQFRTINEHLPLERNFIPLVVYVHGRPEYYSRVVAALRNVTDIGKTLLVVSHDIPNEEMFKISESIDFMQVRLMLHPLDRTERASSFRLKKHWFWIQQQLWEVMFPGYHGDIGFFEEDHILSPDSYQVLKVLCAMKSQGHVSSSVVTLASPNTDPTVSEYDFVAHAVDLDNLVINAGYAFNRSVWTSFKAHPEPFSRRHNWDAALADVLKLDPSLGPLQITSWLSRVRNIGEVGIHTDQKLADLTRDGVLPCSEQQSASRAWYAQLRIFACHNQTLAAVLCEGPSCYGRSRLAQQWELPFTDTDVGLPVRRRLPHPKRIHMDKIISERVEGPEKELTEAE